LALEQTIRLLQPSARAEPELAEFLRLFEMFGSVACLAMLAGYPGTVHPPDWDLLLPQGDSILQAVVHDSAKRDAPERCVLVAQARPSWSRKNLDAPPEEWGRCLREECARQVGSWSGRPDWVQYHRWGLARLPADSRLSGPILVKTSRGGFLGLAGDLFGSEGGVQAAWQSGVNLARRIREEGTYGEIA
jgi:predicted NAD/FAD-dependent oxidoreductase